MISSRLRRVEERSAKRIIILSISGIVTLIIIGVVFGLPMLVKFSLFMDSSRGAAPTPVASLAIITPPELDPLPEATNSAAIAISGVTDPSTELTLIVNNDPVDKITSSSDGQFLFKKVSLEDGSNSIRVKRKGPAGQKDVLSDAVLVERRTSKPKLELTSPEDKKTYSGESNKASITGSTDEGNSITVNDRKVIVNPNGSFHYEYPIPEGETKLKITATDLAGNTNTEERTVTYRK
jgi:hypothetical protein